MAITTTGTFTNQACRATDASRMSRSDDSPQFSPPIESETTSHSLCSSELARPKAFHSTSRFWNPLLGCCSMGRGLGVLFLAALLLGLLPACGMRPQVVFFSPQHGAFIASSKAVEVIGAVLGVDPSDAVLRINGSNIPLGLSQSENSFRAEVMIEGQVLPILAELQVISTGEVYKKRIVVIREDSTPDGDRSQDALSFAFSDGGIETSDVLFEPLLDSLSLDNIFPAGSTFRVPLSSATASPDLEFFVHGLGPLDVMPSGNIVPGSFSLESVSTGILVSAEYEDITLGFSVFEADIDPPFILCAASALVIDSAEFSFVIDQEPGAPASQVSVDVASTAVDASGVGIFSIACPPLDFLMPVLNLGVGELVMETVLEELLGDLLSDTIEAELAQLNVGAAVSSALGANLSAAFTSIDESADGVLYALDAGFTAPVRAPGAPNLFASMAPAATPLVLETTTPLGGSYDLAFGVTSAGLNQLFKAQTETGLGNQSLTSLPGFGPITAGLLAGLFGGSWGAASDPYQIVINPTLPPMMTGRAGPNGEMSELYVPHSMVHVRPFPSGPAQLSVAIDLRTGIDFAVVPESGADPAALTATVSTPAPADIQLEIMTNTVGADPLMVRNQLLNASALMTSQLSTSGLGSIPLPSFLGLDVTPLDLEFSGSRLTVFSDLDGE